MALVNSLKGYLDSPIRKNLESLRATREAEKTEDYIMRSLRSTAILIAIFAFTLWGNSPASAQEQARTDRGSDKQERTALMRAVLGGDRLEVQALLEERVDVNEKSDGGVTALMNAAGTGRIEIMRMLLDKGAEVNAKTPSGYTSLMSAALNGQTEVVKVLIERGAEVNAKAVDGDTALTYATLKGHFEIIQVLREAGAKD